MTQSKPLFTKVNNANALDLFLRTPEEFLVSVEAGSSWMEDDGAMANQFAMAANLLRDAAVKSGTPWFYSYPILFLYRHTIELYLKAIVPPTKPTHDLSILRDSLIEWVKTRYGYDLSGTWVADTITEFAHIDPTSTRFRYLMDNRGQRSFKAELSVNLDVLKTRLDSLFLLLMRLEMARNADAVEVAKAEQSGEPAPKTRGLES